MSLPQIRWIGAAGDRHGVSPAQVADWLEALIVMDASVEMLCGAGPGIAATADLAVDVFSISRKTGNWRGQSRSTRVFADTLFVLLTIARHRDDGGQRPSMRAERKFEPARGGGARFSNKILRVAELLRISETGEQAAAGNDTPGPHCRKCPRGLAQLLQSVFQILWKGNP